MGVAFADALVVPDEGRLHLHKHVDGGCHAQQHQQYTKHDGFLLIGRSGATMRWTKAGPGTAMTDSATRFRPMVGASIEASGALEVVPTVYRNANGGGFGRAVACCECTRRGIGAASGQGRAYGTAGPPRRLTALPYSFLH